MANTDVVEGASAPAIEENFEELFNEFLDRVDIMEGSVVKGKVVDITNDAALIDVGLKAEGRIPLREFTPPGGKPDINVGDEVEVFIERMENRNGEAVLSREKARREESWNQLEIAFNESDRVKGYIVSRVKGGFTVDLGGALAFLPGSQVDIRPVRDIAPLMGDEHEFRILKMDRRRGNIVVSRRSVLEDQRAGQRAELIAGLTEGQVLEGVVKNITDYGAFVDLGGVDGLLHVTDISWRRINHPTEALSIGQTVNVQVIRFNPETQRISLGMKQLEADPWEGVAAKYPVGARYTGRVTNITDYGAFVELEPGIEGLVHVSEMSWTKKNVHPGKIISTSQEVEVEILDVDEDKRRISLGIKQTMENPWEHFAESHPVDSDVEGEVKNITEFGLFVDLGDDLDGMVHMSDISWDKSGEEAIQDFKKGDQVRAKVLDIDTEKERISLGIKQLGSDPMSEAMSGLKRGSIVTCKVTRIMENGIEVQVNDAVQGFIRKGDLSRERSEQRPDRFAAGDRVDAKITSVDKATRKLSLTIKGLEIDEEKKAMKEYGSADSGATLGDILGAALSAKEASGDKPEQEASDAEPEVEVESEVETEGDAEAAAEPAAEEAAEGDAGSDDEAKKDA